MALTDVLRRRVESLEPSQRALVETLAIANNPVPRSVAFAAAGLEGVGVLRALWSLQAQHFVQSFGGDGDGLVQLCHDRMRESVVDGLSSRRTREIHLALGRALRPHDDALFDTVRHLNAATRALDDGEREELARLNWRAGIQARRAAAFPLALDYFQAGIAAVGDPWATDYDLALRLHNGAAEAAYLSARWEDAAEHVATVKAHARSVLDQLPSWEAQIDTAIAHNEFGAAVDAGVEVLGLLGVDLPGHPGETEIRAAITATLSVLAEVGPQGFAALDEATSSTVIGASRVLIRLCSAAYFGRPTLFPIIASHLVGSAVDDGISSATPYGLSVFAIVLNSIGQLRDGHTWAGVAVGLIDRFQDRSLEARTLHCAQNLAGNLIVELRSTLQNSRRIIDIGLAAGDVEYAAYSAHAWVHNAFYAGLPLDEVWTESLATSEFMRGYGQINALHVHVICEQVLRCFTGRNEDSARLDGGGFDEVEFVASAVSSGSRSALFLCNFLMGFVRYHFDAPEEASRCLEIARSFIDGAASTWHLPMHRQYSVLAIAAHPDATPELLDLAESDAAALEELAELCPENYAHRAALVRGALAHHRRDYNVAIGEFEVAMMLAEAQWPNDVALAAELAARCAADAGDSDGAARYAATARSGYEAWGAVAKLTRI